MCLAVPLKVEAIDGKNGICSFSGIKRSVRMDFVPSAQIGQYVIVHAGFAIEIIKEKEALESIAAFKEIFENESDQ